jgi:hypothetical protein
VIAIFALALAAPPADRSLDPEAPIEVAAPPGEEIDVDGAELEEAEPGEPVPPPVDAALDVGRAEDQAKPKKRWREVKRKGPLVMAGIGAGGCTQDQCEPMKATPWLSIMGGYRFGRFAPILVVQGGAAPAEAPEAVLIDDGEPVPLTESTDTRGFLHIGAGTLLHLLATTPFDPYFGLTIGYLRTSTRFRANATVSGQNVAFDLVDVAHRGALGVVIGLAFRIRERFSIGPRVDVLVPFAGKVCVGEGGGGDRVCTDMNDVETVDPGQYFPRPWAATLQLGFVI